MLGVRVYILTKMEVENRFCFLKYFEHTSLPTGYTYIFLIALFCMLQPITVFVEVVFTASSNEVCGISQEWGGISPLLHNVSHAKLWLVSITARCVCYVQTVSTIENKSMAFLFC